MRRIIKRGSKVYDPTNRLGTAMVRADDIQDRTLLSQVVVLAKGRAALLDVRSRGLRGVVLVDERGVEHVVIGRAALVLSGHSVGRKIGG